MTRLSLLLCTALILIAPTATAQTYETGSQMTGEPQSSAQFDDDDGVEFPDLSPGQIADDVTTQFNARTGEKEFLAATFDPFEAEPDLSARVNLRSLTSARDLNGDPLVDGVLVDVSVFYTDAGDRRFGLTRDAMFLNGAPVPIVLSDSRELECSARITEHIYRNDHSDNRYSGAHIWIRPTYRGHYGFRNNGRWGGYGSPRSRHRARPGSRPRAYPRVNPRPNPRANPRSRPDTPIPYYPHTDPRVDGGEVIRPRPRSAPRSERRGQDLPTTIITPDVRLPTPVAPRSEQRRVTPRAAPTPASTPAPRSAPRAEPRPQPRPRPAPAPKRREAPVSRPTLRSNSSERSRVVHDMFPGDGYDDAIVVSSQRDCAREDQLVLFIPNDRLDAARFDGLTLILRDVTYDPQSGQTTVYDERPLYIPPNYIEGFRLAISRP